MNDVDKAYRAGYISALMVAKAHHMKVVGEWHYCTPDAFEGYISDEKLEKIKLSSHVPYCSICGSDALFEQSADGKYVYALTDYCPKCGSIMNPEIANKSPDDSIREQTEQFNELYNCILDDLGNEVD